MATIISGEVATSATLGLNADQIVTHMKDAIFLLEPSKTMLTLLANQVRRVEVDNPKVEWLEDERTPEITRVDGAHNSSVGTIAVINGNYATANATARIQRTGEVILIGAVASNDWTGCTRGWGGTSGAALLDGDQVTILGGTAEEGAVAETSRATKTTSHYNLTEIIRDPFGATRTAINTRTYGGGTLAHLQKARGIEHAIKIELKAWFQERNIDNSGADPRRSMGSIDEIISTNRKNFTGNVTLVELFDWGEDAFRYGSKTKMLFAARGPMSNISLLAAGRLNTVPSDQVYGMNIKELVTPHGRWLLTMHDLFTGDYYGTRGYSIDLANLQYAYFTGADTVLTTNIQVGGGADKRKDEFLTEATIFRMQEKTHAVGLSMST